MKVSILASAALVVGAFAAIQATAKAPTLDLTYQRFVLQNGLTVIVHEDHSAPSVTVGVWYHVGSKNEPAGHTGFAHLFEHLMFNGSEHYNGEWFKAMQAVGATGVNGTTNLDRTNFFQTVPTPALDRVLWMESDRMGHLLGGVTQAKLDQQRGVVQNEKRQDDNRPYGHVNYNLYEGLFPPEHPYHHSTIGSMADLDAATLPDVQNWFRSYYGPNNAVLVIAGDVNPADARSRAERFFGDIPAGPAVDAWTAWAPAREHATREIQYDDVPGALAERVWAVPGVSSRDHALLDLAGSVIGTGRNSRLSRELVHDREVASDVGISVEQYELAGVFDLSVTLKAAQDVGVASEAMDRIMAAFLKSGPTKEELERAQVGINAGYVRGLENPRSMITVLAEGELYAHDPAFVAQYLKWINAATIEEVRDAAQRYLARGSHEVDVLPRKTFSVVASNVDRAAGLPSVPKDSPTLKFPALETATLANGLRVVVAERHSVPAVSMAIQFQAGYATDAGGRLGRAKFAMQMLTEGTQSRDALSIASEQERLGAHISSNSGLDTSSVSLVALSDQLVPSIALWADVVMNAAFPPDAVERYRGAQLAQIQQEEAEPASIAQRILPQELFGKGNPYAVPFTGSGTEEGVRGMTRPDLVEFKRSWLRPDNATVYVSGDTSLAQVQPLLERAFQGWHSPTVALTRRVETKIAPATVPRVILVDHPGAEQSYILAGELGPGAGDPEFLAPYQASVVLGGGFNSRLNMNLREDKHWSYGVFAYMYGARHQSPFLIVAPVQSDKTGDAMREILAELSAINRDRPITVEEMDATVGDALRGLPASLQSQNSLLGSMLGSAMYGLPPDYTARYPELYRALTLEQVHKGARELIRPESLTWIVVGDRARIEKQIATLHIAPIEHFSAKGQPGT